MITEKTFASSHHAFWRDLLPMGEHYVRTTNLGLARFTPPMSSSSEPRFHGIVNELAFRLYTRSVNEGITLPMIAVEPDLQETLHFISSFRQHGRGSLPTPGPKEILDARKLATRIAEFFTKSCPSPPIFRPAFPGCGWLSECEGDVLGGNVLYEVKSGARKFRMLDLKQALIYCALNFAAKNWDIRDVCLVNPRTGLYFSAPLRGLCQSLAGRTTVEVLGDIVEYASDHGQEYSLAN